MAAAEAYSPKLMLVLPYRPGEIKLEDSMFHSRDAVRTISSSTVSAIACRSERRQFSL